VDTRRGTLKERDRRRGAGEEDEEESCGGTMLEMGFVERRLRPDLRLGYSGDDGRGVEGWIVKKPAPRELEDLCEGE
jgi:hypothetical protein